MSEDTDNIKKTWARSIEPVMKIGYMDGASDGQTIVFQDSFNVGYEQGLNFGLELGLRHAISGMSRQNKNMTEAQDQQQKQNINCHICTNGVKDQENIGNLYNMQKEKNECFLRCNLD